MSDGLYGWLLFLHILAAMVWVGGAVLLGVLAIRAVHDGDPGAVGKFIANMRVIGPVVLAPATVAVVGLGVWLVLDSAAWDFGQLWVQLALALSPPPSLSELPTRAGPRSAPSGPSSETNLTRHSTSSAVGRGAIG